MVLRPGPRGAPTADASYLVAAAAAMTKIKADPDGPEAQAQAEACLGERTYHELLVNLNPIAQPLASRRLTRKLYKCIKKGAAAAAEAGGGAGGGPRPPD